MTAKQHLLGIIGKVSDRLGPTRAESGFESKTLTISEKGQQSTPGTCPCCGVPLTTSTSSEENVIHNPHTCRLVNLVLGEMRVRLKQQIRVEIYTSYGPLRGFYSTADPYSIHVSEEAYVEFPEYIIFHETKHLVDCLTKGWSEEGTPDTFARYLCAKYGYRWPPPHQQAGLVIFNGVWNEAKPGF